MCRRSFWLPKICLFTTGGSRPTQAVPSHLKFDQHNSRFRLPPEKIPGRKPRPFYKTQISSIDLQKYYFKLFGDQRVAQFSGCTPTPMSSPEIPEQTMIRYIHMSCQNNTHVMSCHVMSKQYRVFWIVQICQIYKQCKNTLQNCWWFSKSLIEWLGYRQPGKGVYT